LLIVRFRPNNLRYSDDPFRFFAEKMKAAFSPFVRLVLDAMRQRPVAFRDNLSITHSVLQFCCHCLPKFSRAAHENTPAAAKK